MSKGVALVAGATGITGSGIVDQLLVDGGWEVLALSRNVKSAAMPKDVTVVSGDLTSKESLKKALSGHRVTNLFYAAIDYGVVELTVPGQVNLQMLKTLVEALIEQKHPLRHVLAVHGGKYYGHHLGPDGWDNFKNVFVEDAPDARHPFPDDHYHLQEDYLIETGPRYGFTWSTVRPTVVIGYAYSMKHVYFNFGTTFAVYAILMRELGHPLVFPSGEKAYNCLYTIVSNQTLGKLAVFTANEPKCAGQGFNSSNVTFCWRDLLPKLAAYFGMDYSGPNPEFDIEKALENRQDVWKEIVKKYNLSEPNLGRVFDLSDMVDLLKIDYDSIFSPEKRARYGCLVEEDNLETFTDLFERLQNKNIIPKREKLRSSL